MSNWPTDKELLDMGLYINCPDCGEFLWDELIQDYREECPRCRWPQPDHQVESRR